MSGSYHHSHIELFYSQSKAMKDERKRINRLKVKQRKMIFDFGLTKERYEKINDFFKLSDEVKTKFEERYKFDQEAIIVSDMIVLIENKNIKRVILNDLVEGVGSDLKKKNSF